MRSSCILFHLFALVSFAVDVTYAISPAPIKDRQNDNGDGENEVRYPSVSNKPTHNSRGRKLVPRRRRTKSAKHPKATKAKDKCSCDDERSSSNELTCVELADSMGMKISLRRRRLEPITLSIIAIFAAKAIATGVLAKAGGEGLGWVMNQVGITDKTATAEDVAKVSEMVAKVDKDIEFLRMEVAAGFATMRDEFDLTRATILQTQLTSATTSVKAIFDDYKSFIRLFDLQFAEENEEVRNMVKTLQTKIISSDTGIRYQVKLIHNVLMGSGLFSGEGLLSTYSRLAMQNSDCTYKYSKYMNDFLEYYISHQVTGLLLMVEAYNAFDSSTKEVLKRDYYSDWTRMINLQIKWVNNISPMATFVEGPYNLGVIRGRVTSLAIRGNQILALSVHGTLTIKSMDRQSARPLKELGDTFLSTFIGIHDTRNSGKVIVASSGSYRGKSVIKVGIFPTYRGSPLGDSSPYSQSYHSKGALGIDGIYALSYHLDKSTGFLYFLEIGGIRTSGKRTLSLSRVNTGRGGVNQYIERVVLVERDSWILDMIRGKEHVWALGMVGRNSVIIYIKVGGYLKFARVYDLSTNKYVNEDPGGQDLTDLQVTTTDGVIKVKNDREVLTVSLDGEKTVIPVRVNTKPHSSAVSLGMNTYSSSNSGVMMQGGKSVRFNPNFEVEAFALDRANQMWVAGREVGKDTTSVYKVGKTREVDEIPTLQAVVDQYG